MVDDAEFIAKCEDELWQILDKMHKAGVRFKVTHSILEEMIKTLEIQGYAEGWLKQFNK